MDLATEQAIAAVTAGTGSCWLCGDAVQCVPHGDEWAWSGPDGKITGTDTDLRPLYADGGDPFARLAWLAEAMGAAMAACGGPRGTKAQLTPLYWAAAREYSGLKVRLETGLSFHVHAVIARTARRALVPPGPLPWHCAWPMRLTPSGWACRQCEHRQDGAGSEPGQFLEPYHAHA